MRKRTARTEDERKRQNVKNQNNYLHNLDVKAAAGDKKAQKQINKNRRNKYLSTAKNFIKKHATLEEVSIFRDLLAERVKELRNKKD